MKWSVILIAAGFLFLSCTTRACAQEPQDQEVPERPNVEGTRSPLAAGLLEWAVPTVGYAYAGNWRRGIVPNLVVVGGLVLTLNAFVEESMDVWTADEPECDTGCWIGLALLVGGKIWAIAGAVDEASDFNRRLRGAVSAMTLETTAGGGLSVGLRVNR